MDISSLINLAGQMSQQRTSQTAELLVLKKAIHLQQANAMTLIASVTPSTNLPPHLGQNVNTTA